MTPTDCEQDWLCECDACVARRDADIDELRSQREDHDALADYHRGELAADRRCQ